MRTVVLLGAGASAASGYPITTQILERIWADLKSGSRKHGWKRWGGMRRIKNANTQLTRLIRSLLPGARTAKQYQSASIVDILSLVDLMLIEGRSPDAHISHEQLRMQRHLLEIAINGVLQGRRALHHQTRLARWIVREASRSSRHRVGVVTMNYDTLLEQKLYRMFGRGTAWVPSTIDFGIPWRDPGDRLWLRPHDAPLAVFKLHGSLNWLRCEVCGYIYINPQKRVSTVGFWRKRSRAGHNVCVCEGLLRTIMVVPSAVRDVRDPNLLSVWQAALEEIRRADRLIVVGYSMPSEDTLIRSLLLRAQAARAGRPFDVTVVQLETPPENATETETYQRFRTMFPPSELPEDRYLRDGFTAWVDNEIRPVSDGGIAKAKRAIQRRVSR